MRTRVASAAPRIVDGALPRPQPPRVPAPQAHSAGAPQESFRSLVKKVKLDTFSSVTSRALPAAPGATSACDCRERCELGWGWGSGGARAQWFEGVEGQRVGLEGPGTPGTRLGGTRTSRRWCRS